MEKWNKNEALSGAFSARSCFAFFTLFDFTLLFSISFSLHTRALSSRALLAQLGCLLPTRRPDCEWRSSANC